MTSGGYSKKEAWALQQQHRTKTVRMRAAINASRTAIIVGAVSAAIFYGVFFAGWAGAAVYRSQYQTPQCQEIFGGYQLEVEAVFEKTRPICKVSSSYLKPFPRERYEAVEGGE